MIKKPKRIRVFDGKVYFYRGKTTHIYSKV